MSPQRIPLKDQLLTQEKVTLMAREIEQAHSAFGADDFVSSVLARFPELGLMARIDWIAECLERHLPHDFRRGVSVVLRSLPAPVDPKLSDGDFGDFIYAPYAAYVARHGCTAEQLEFSLAALREITTRFSAEFALRPFLDAFPDEVLATLLTWTDAEHYHVRRLCSEATRPRLPWARNLRLPYDAAIPILDRLFADPTRYVTRSVANHVNDVSKKDPDLALDILERWRATGHQEPHEMNYIARHAGRSLVKQGYPRALELLGRQHSCALATTQPRKLPPTTTAPARNTPIRQPRLGGTQVRSCG